MQNEFTEACRVFEDNGKVQNAGWAKKLLLDYNIDGRHSQRDSYFVTSDECSMYLSIENLGADFGIKIAGNCYGIADDFLRGIIDLYWEQISPNELGNIQINNVML